MDGILYNREEPGFQNKRQIKKGWIKSNPLTTGAGKRSRTPDLMITNQLLYQLSYAGIATHYAIVTRAGQNSDWVLVGQTIQRV